LALLVLEMMRSWFALLFAQTARSTPMPSAVDSATIEFLKSQFQSFTTSFNIYVTLLSAVTAVFVGVGAWFFKRTLDEAKQEVDRLVKAEIRRAIAERVERRIDDLERVLEREEVPGLVSVDYVLQQTGGTLPKEYRLLNARFPKLRLRKFESRKLTADVVVLDLVNYVPEGGQLTDAEVDRVLEDAIEKLAAESVLVVYVRGRFGAIERLGQKVSYYTSANVPTQLLGNVINSAYVARTFFGEE
jgi:hypothetical protein